MHIKFVVCELVHFGDNYTHTSHDVINIMIVVIITERTNELK